MKFFFDENLTPKVIEPLRPLFARSHELISIFDFDAGRLVSADDPALLSSLHDFDVFVTQDRSQLQMHRDALLASGLHWVGLSSPRVGDLHGLASAAAALIAGLPHALDVIEGWRGHNGCWLNLQGMQREQRQRVKVLNSPQEEFTAKVFRLGPS